MDIITRKQAQEQGLPHYFTGKACKNGHLSPRLTTRRNCVECLQRRPVTESKATPLVRRQILDSVNAGLGYVYAYLRAENSPNGRRGTPYYVGMSMVGNRPWQPHRIVENDLRPSDPSQVVILRHALTRQEAFAWEAFYVSRFGFVREGGLLWNLKDGGAGGVAGVMHTPESVAKRAEALSRKTAQKLGIPFHIYDSLSRGRKNLVRLRWNKGLRGQDLLVAKPRQRGTAAQLAASAKRTYENAIALGVNPDAFASLDRSTRSKVRMRFKMGWPAERLMEGC